MSFTYLSFLANVLSDVAEIDIKVVLSNITATAAIVKLRLFTFSLCILLR